MIYRIEKIWLEYQQVSIESKSYTFRTVMVNSTPTAK